MQLSLGGSRGWEQRVHSSNQSCEQSCHQHHSSDNSHGHRDKSTVFLPPSTAGREGKKEDEAPEQVCKVPIK